MASILTGYEYDIFISYRQKDNKGNRWVSEFVDALKDELESTFKEEISVYFDINPHDGLLETHNVDASLKEKLKCLVFIPIISQTYCDPKSFAWQQEFCVFNKLAKEDQFGRDIRLAGGNVASRILPVKIHDLDSEDKTLLENELGGVLRGVEFIYKEPGVNRPLTNYDDEKKNLNSTRYCNQINKVSNAVKEIISGLKLQPSKSVSEQNEVLSTIKKPVAPKKSIIVLPFENISSDPEQEYFSDGLTEEIITDLSHITDLRVISRSSAMTFKGTKFAIKEIAEKVNVRYVLEGSVRKASKNLRITAQLIDATYESHLWAEKYNGTLENIFEIQEKVSRAIVLALKLKLTHEGNIRIKEKPIPDAIAFEYYLRAKHEVWSFNQERLDQALQLTNQALGIVGENALLYSTLALIFWQYHNAGFKPEENMLLQADNNARKALDLDPELSQGHWVKGAIAYTRGELKTAASHYKLAAESEAGGEALAWLGYINAIAGRMHEARLYGGHAIGVDPLNILALCFRGVIEIYGGDFKNAVGWLQKGIEVMPGDPMTKAFFAVALLYAGNREQSITIFDQLINANAGFISLLGAMWKAALLADSKSFKKITNNLQTYARRDKEFSWLLADCFAITGEIENAMDWLANSIGLGLINDHFFSEIDPFLAPLKRNRHFQALMQDARDKQLTFVV